MCQSWKYWNQGLNKSKMNLIMLWRFKEVLTPIFIIIHINKNFAIIEHNFLCPNKAYINVNLIKKREIFTKIYTCSINYLFVKANMEEWGYFNLFFSNTIFIMKIVKFLHFYFNWKATYIPCTWFMKFFITSFINYVYNSLWSLIFSK